MLQPLDNVKVKNVFKQLPPRPNLSTSTQVEAGESLEKHNQETARKIETNQTKLKKQTNLNKKEKEKAIEQMLAKSSCEIGIAPFTKKHTYKVCESMTQKGILKRSENLETRLQRTTRSLVMSWTKKNLKMTDNDWNDVKIKKITQPISDEAEIVFLSFEDRDEITKLTSRAKYLSQSKEENSPRFVTYVDPRARKRFNAIQVVAKSIRTKSNGSIQTSIRNGKQDFLLRQRQKDDTTPWGQIPPLKLDLNLPQFEIGMYKNIYECNEENIPEEEVMEDEDENEQELSKEIKNQYEQEQIHKRNLTSQSVPSPPKHKKRRDIQPEGSGAEADNESDTGSGRENNAKSYLHSTLRDPTPSKSSLRESPGAKTVPETPDNQNYFTRYHSEPTNKPYLTYHTEVQDNTTTKTTTTTGLQTHHE